MLLGKSVLGLLDPADPVILSFAELGVLVLLFEIGLHTDLKSLMKVGNEAIRRARRSRASIRIRLWRSPPHWDWPTIPSIVAGAALTATSIGISAAHSFRPRSAQHPEGQIVLGAAVLDDIVGLVILSVVSGIVGGVRC